MGNGEKYILNVGLVGHIDHGKTTLLQKLSGKWTDTHSEELKRGITVKLGYADAVICEDNGNYNISGKGRKVREVSFVDAPGHEMLMATMLSGAALIDAAILVVAANEGIKPQTREHLMALKAKNIENLIVVQNKIDLVSEDKAKENYEEIKSFLKGWYEDAVIVPVSAQQGVNINVLWKELAKVPNPKRDLSGEPVFLIARSFDINKPGTRPERLHGAVLGGTLKEGRLKVGDKIEIKPGRVVKEANKYRYETLKTEVVGLYRGSKRFDELVPGGSMSVEVGLDMALGKSDILSGNVVGELGKLPDLTQKVRVKFKLFPEVFGANERINVEPVKNSEVLMLSINTSTTGGGVSFVRDDELEIVLRVPVIAFKDDYVGIARNVRGHWRLIGYGKIL